MFNAKILLAIVVIAAILFAIFGGNPFEDMREKAIQRKQFKLLKDIMENGDPTFKAKYKAHQRGEYVPPDPNKMRMIGVDTSEDKSRIETVPEFKPGQRARGPAKKNGAQGGDDNLPIGTIGGKRPTTTYQQPWEQQAPVKTQPQVAPAPRDEYYPPAATGGSRSKPMSYKPLPPPTGGRPMLIKGGQRVVFNGTNAYKIDASGKQVTLPDGDYPMFGGAYTMKIRNGEKVANN